MCVLYLYYIFIWFIIHMCKHVLDLLKINQVLMFETLLPFLTAQFVLSSLCHCLLMDLIMEKVDFVNVLSFDDFNKPRLITILKSSKLFFFAFWWKSSSLDLVAYNFLLNLNFLQIFNHCILSCFNFLKPVTIYS